MTHQFDVSVFWMFLSFLLQNGKRSSRFYASPVKLFSKNFKKGRQLKCSSTHCKATLKCSVWAYRISQRFVQATHTLTKLCTFSLGWQCCNAERSKADAIQINSQYGFWKGTNCVLNFLLSFIRLIFFFKYNKDFLGGPKSFRYVEDLCCSNALI